MGRRREDKWLKKLLEASRSAPASEGVLVPTPEDWDPIADRLDPVAARVYRKLETRAYGKLEGRRADVAIPLGRIARRKGRLGPRERASLTLYGLTCPLVHQLKADPRLLGAWKRGGWAGLVVAFLPGGLAGGVRPAFGAAEFVFPGLLHDLFLFSLLGWQIRVCEGETQHPYIGPPKRGTPPKYCPVHRHHGPRLRMRRWRRRQPRRKKKGA
jgi:hypothetical protein